MLDERGSGTCPYVMACSKKGLRVLIINAS